MRALMSQLRLLYPPFHTHPDRPLLGIRVGFCGGRKSPQLGEDGELVDLLEPQLLLAKVPGHPRSYTRVEALCWGCRWRQVPLLCWKL